MASSSIESIIENSTYSIDIAFLLDATGSMADTIEGVKNHIQETVKGIQDKYAQCAIRVGVIAYRDYDVEGGIEKLDFTTDLIVFKQFLGDIIATGGDDDAEDVNSGIEGCLTLSWASNARIVIHVADAPGHGHQFHTNRVSDNFLAEDPNSERIQKALDALFDEENCNVNLYQFLHLNNNTQRMIQEFKRVVKNKAHVILEERLDNNRSMPARFIHSSIRSIERSQSLRTPNISALGIRKFSLDDMS